MKKEEKDNIISSLKKVGYDYIPALISFLIFVVGFNIILDEKSNLLSKVSGVLIVVVGFAVYFFREKILKKILKKNS